MYGKKLLMISLVGLALAGCASGGSKEKDGKTSSEARSESQTSSVVSSAHSPASNSQTNIQTSGLPGIGETVTVGDIKITVNSAQTLDEVGSYSTASRLEAGKKYELIELTVDNQSDQSVILTPIINFELKNGEGSKQKYELPADLDSDKKMDVEIAPGEKKTGQLIYMADEQGELTLNVTATLGTPDTAQIRIR